MVWMTIELNKEKVQQEKIYNYDKMVKALDEICEDTDFIVEAPGQYYLPNEYDEIGTFVVLCSRFRQQTWLIQNIKSWIVKYDDGSIEDALESYLKVQKRAKHGMDEID